MMNTTRKISTCVILMFVLIFAACSRGDMGDTADNVADVSFRTGSIPPAPAVESAPSMDAPTFASPQDVDDWSPAYISASAVSVADDAADDFQLETMDSFPEFTLGEPVAPRMIIRSADMGLSTYYFEDTVTGIERIMANRGGFVENSHQWMVPASHDNTLLLWRAEFVLRVPVGLFDQVNRELVALAQVQRFSTVSEDVTLEFSDLGSRLRIREEELRRVELMLDAAENLRDIINLEAQVTTLHLAVDAYQRRMTEIDQLASFSTIRIAVHEVVEIEEVEEEEKEKEEEEEYYPVAYYDTFGTRFTGAFSASVDFITVVLTNVAVFLALVGLPFILIAGVVFILYKINKKIGFMKIRFRA